MTTEVINPVLSACRILEDVETAKGPLAKTAFLKMAEGEVGEVVKAILKGALDPFITYGVTWEPIERDATLPDDCDLLEVMAFWKVWTDTLEQMASRKLTGNRAKDAITVTLGAFPIGIRKWLVRMLNKNIRIGLAEKGVLKVYPGLFKVFGCQLCEKWKDIEKLPERAIVEPKYDGARCLLFLDPARPLSLSREGKPVNNMGHVIAELMPLLAGNVVDGEAFNQNWEGTQSAVFRDEDGNTDARYMIFDVVPIDEFLAGRAVQPLYSRRAIINHAVNGGAPLQYVRWNPGKIVLTEAELETVMAEYLEQGHEGVVIKDLDATYKFKRSKDWIKHKPWIDVDLPIVGFTDGEGKWTGGLGAVVVEGGEERIARSEVGSGLTDEMRRYIWANRDRLLGTIVEVRYQNLTPERKLRFPIFSRLRSDRKA